MLTPPAVRFVRCFDPVDCRMLNVWFLLDSQQQIDDVPMALELSVQAKTIDECMTEIRKWETQWKIDSTTVAEIEKASGHLRSLKAPFYGTISEYHDQKS